MKRVFVCGAMAALLAACSHDAAPSVLTLVYNHRGFTMEPPPPASPPATWSPKQARAAITKGNPDGDRTRVWFGYYQGRPAWLAIADDVDLAIPAPPGVRVPARGFSLSVFADGVTPPQTLAGLAAGGRAPRPNVAPPRPHYDGRLHITYITPGAAQVAATPTKWMIEPAPNKTAPRMSRDEAMRRSRAAGVNQVDAHSTRAYFGLFTGLDSAGAPHAKAPAWLVVGTYADGRFAVTVFTDDIAVPWVTGRLFVARPFVY